jgi:hypothetical protein
LVDAARANGANLTLGVNTCTELRSESCGKRPILYTPCLWMWSIYATHRASLTLSLVSKNTFTHKCCSSKAPHRPRNSAIDNRATNA